MKSDKELEAERQKNAAAFADESQVAGPRRGGTLPGGPASPSPQTAAEMRASGEYPPLESQRALDDHALGEGTGSILGSHLTKFKKNRGTAPNAEDQQHADKAAIRVLIADLILSSASGVMDSLTEAEQVTARSLAARLKI